MKKKILGFTISAVAVIVVAVASFVSFKVYNANAGADKGVAAKVNGEIIYVNDLKQSYADHPQIQNRVPFEEFYAKTLDVFVNSKLVYQAAQKAKIEETPEYQRQLVTAKEDLARKLYLEKVVDEQVNDKAIQDLYDEYKAKFESQKEIKAKHILVDSEDKAEEVINKLKKGEDFVLVAAEQGDLFAVTFKLNAGNGITAAEWLNTPSYYKVEMINKDKNHLNYGKVLGLDEGGDIAWVAPENVDLTKPEGQFAIDQHYTFTNRENGAKASWILNGELYQVEKDVYAVVHPNWSEGNDTLRITPITTYKSSDGFKRFTAADLNANTYTVAMKLLNGAFLNIIENHDDKHRIGLDEDNATEWRIEMPTVKLKDVTGDFTRMAADTAKVETAIEYYVDGDWHKTQIDNPEAKYYYPNTELQICTYVLKNTDNGEYLYGMDNNESAGNAYYVCNEDKKTATRIAFKIEGDSTVNLVPVYGSYSYKVGDYSAYWTKDWMTGMSAYESDYKEYTSDLYLSNNKIIGGTTTLAGVLKDTYLYTAPSNDVFTINVAEAPTYKKLAQGDKILSIEIIREEK